MAQQINLFDPELRRQKRIFSTRTLAQGMAVILTVMLGATGYQAYVAADLRREAARAKNDHDRLQRETAQLKSAPPRVPSPVLQEELRLTEAATLGRERLVDRLNAGDFGTADGTSHYFTALARKTADGVWLTLIQVDAANAKIALRGRVLKPELLPAYVERIGTEASLRGHMFSQMNLSAREEDVAKSGSKRDRTRPQRFFEFELGVTRSQGESK